MQGYIEMHTPVPPELQQPAPRLLFEARPLFFAFQRGSSARQTGAEGVPQAVTLAEWETAYRLSDEAHWMSPADFVDVMLDVDQEYLTVKYAEIARARERASKKSSKKSG